MTGIVLSIHVVACILLILIVLLQTGKGSDMGASFGSASGGQAFFGSTGPATVLSKITTAVAVIFMLTSLTLAYTSGHKSTKSIMSESVIPIEKSVDNNSESDTSKAAE
ncbi:SecG [Desulfamplus magnetovallimortis]|uniref:Protein-export membrane protein SecG n=1 Tax=Desulfamplus magnetovallimortis TaxID=1246637 RepID=A0A1W1H4Q6_9BACT|nr:preprotein translocase subunit SecG [Desulfamplus magnetovallimortis]SLM27422.1 SecG [Desulfamplus magnetovallimortis]